MTEELKSAMREASKSLSAAIEDMADKVNAVLASRDMKMAARSVLADKLRKAASRKDLNWQTLFDALCVKSRSEAVAALAAMIDPKGILTERERHILDIWPRFEDGAYVWFGDELVHEEQGHRFPVEVIELMDDGWRACYQRDGVRDVFRPSERVKSPIQSVLDADGVEIRAGDTVWHEDGSELLVEELNRYGARCFDGDKRRTFNPKYLTHTRPAPKVLDADGVEIHVGDTVWIIPAVTDTPDEPYGVKGINKYGEVLLDFHFERSTGMKGEYLTHTRPDSWKRIVEDMKKSPCAYFGFLYKDCDEGDGCPADEPVDCRKVMTIDIIRRAKALAGVEVEA